MTKLTNKQLKILTLLAEDKELIICKRQYWIDENRFAKKDIDGLIIGCCISQDSFSTDQYQIWTINETGRQALKKGYRLDVLDYVVNKYSHTK